MGLILSKEPGIYSGSSISLDISTTPDVAEYMITTNGIPPILAKYIAYDNLSPRNPFIATVEDGLGNILLDGGFPKWYNDNCNASWVTYSDLSPSYKYLYDAIDFISNASKVNIGNKKILIIGDQTINDNYSIKSATSNGFKTSIDKVCSIKGYIPTYLDCNDFDGIVLNPSYTYLDQFSCILFFSTSYTNIQKISNESIASLIAYRENGSGIFFITDHGDRDLTSVEMAAGTTLNYFGFYRTANFIVTNFGCYFSGNYNRSPVNVGYLRTNYGNHILWKNLADTDYIYAGGSESKVVITEYPIYTGTHTETLLNDGYHALKFLLKYTNGSLQSINSTYGLNVPEVIYFLDKNNTNIVSQDNNTFLKKQSINFKIDYHEDANGLIKLNGTPIGTFNFNKASEITTQNLNSGVASEFNTKIPQSLSIQMTNPLSYTKTLNWNFSIPDFSLRTSKVINQINRLEFRNKTTTSKIRNVSKLLTSKDIPIEHIDLRFTYHKIYDYFFLDPLPPEATTGMFSVVQAFGATTVYAMVYYNEKYYVSTDKGLLYSLDLENWEIVSQTSGLHTIDIYTYNNYIVVGMLSGKVLISSDYGITWSLKTFGSEHIYGLYIETFDNQDYLHVGTQGGKYYKYNIITSTIVMNTTLSNSYIFNIIRYNNLIILVGYKFLAYLTDAGVLTKIDLITLVGSDLNTSYLDLVISPTGLYCISADNILNSTDGMVWSKVNCDTKLDDANKKKMIYNPDRNEYLIGYGNDINFAITKDFINVTYNETFNTRQNNNGISDLLWEPNYNRYIILSRLFEILNLPV